VVWEPDWVLAHQRGCQTLLALGYEDLNDHETLRHDPLMAVLAGKLKARRADCAAVAGKSTLNRLELSKPEPSRYHKISYDAEAVDRLFVDLFLEAHPPRANEKWNTCLGQFRVQVGHAHDLIA
jgi:hypothetical protein